MTPSQEKIAALAKLFQVEKQEELDRYKIFLDSKTPQARKKEGMAWFPVKVEETGYGLASLPFAEVSRNPGDQGPHFFSRGTPLTVIDEESKQQRFGHVLAVGDSTMKIALSGDDIPEWIDGQLSVNMVFDTKTFEEGEKALSAVLNAEKGRLMQLREILLGDRQVQFGRDQHFQNEELNPSQNAAINHLLAAEDVSVVYGPPGTGKTTTLAEGIKQLVKREVSVLACAPSNAAVDHLANQLINKGLNVVRLGVVSKIDDKVFTRSLEYLVNAHPQSKDIEKLRREASELRKQASAFKRNFGPEERERRKQLYRDAREIREQVKELEHYVMNSIVGDAEVVCATLVGSTSRTIRDRQFGCVVIDEAGQALEPLCWVPIQKANKIVLSGDPHQLPPTVKSEQALRGGLGKTLLDRVIKMQEVSTMLDIQYRMNEQIMAFSNMKFYENKLRAADSVANWHVDERVVEFIDTAGCGYDEGIGEASQSRFNEGEISLIEKHLKDMPVENEIAVIAPYREQVTRLQIRFAGVSHVKVETVDSFQGQERDVVYISLVRSNDKGEIGFLKDYRRLNVAMTRAKKKLVIIGDSATVGQDKFFASLIDFCEQKEYYRSAWEFVDY